MSASQKCQYKNEKYPDFTCDEPTIDTGSKFCIFHDINYLKGDNYEKNKQEVARRFERKLSECSSNHSPLKFIGYFLPEVSFENRQFNETVSFSEAYFYGAINFNGATFSGRADFNGATFSGRADFGATHTVEKGWTISYGPRFTKETVFSKATFYELANFSQSIFSEKADFNGATFSNQADFSYAKFSAAEFKKVRFVDITNFYHVRFNAAEFNEATFSKEADLTYAEFSNFTNFYRTKFLNEVRFSEAIFNGKTLFYYTIFEQPNKVIFDTNDLSKVSFAGTDISKVNFTDRVRWGGEDGLKVIEDDWLEKLGKEKTLEPEPIFDLALYVYRRLRENYEFKLKFDEAGKFFIKEMELKRKYRNVRSKSSNGFGVKSNCWFRRNLSLTGLYYHFSNYGESIVRPTIIGAITIALSTLFWLMQSKPTLEPHFFVNSSSNLYHSTSHFVYLNQAGNSTHWLTAFQRSLADFLPLLSLPGEIKVGVIDYVIKIVGGALTFGLLIIALRRKFERKYTR